jgi:hypothetical protein
MPLGSGLKTSIKALLDLASIEDTEAAPNNPIRKALARRANGSNETFENYLRSASLLGIAIVHSDSIDDMLNRWDYKEESKFCGKTSIVYSIL